MSGLRFYLLAAAALSSHTADAKDCEFMRSTYLSSSGTYELRLRAPADEGATAIADFDLVSVDGKGTAFQGEAYYTNGFSSPRYMLKMSCSSVKQSLWAGIGCKLKSDNVEISRGERWYTFKAQKGRVVEVPVPFKGQPAPRALLIPDLSRNIWYGAQSSKLNYVDPSDLFYFKGCS